MNVRKILNRKISVAVIGILLISIFSTLLLRNEGELRRIVEKNDSHITRYDIRYNFDENGDAIVEEDIDFLPLNESTIRGYRLKVSLLKQDPQTQSDYQNNYNDFELQSVVIDGKEVPSQKLNSIYYVTKKYQSCPDDYRNPNTGICSNNVSDIGQEVIMYNPMKIGETYNYKVKYKLTKLVVKNGDISQFYHKIIASSNTTHIENFKALLSFPENIRIQKSYIHGNRNLIMNQTGNKVEVNSDYVLKESMVELNTLLEGYEIINNLASEQIGSESIVAIEERNIVVGNVFNFIRNTFIPLVVTPLILIVVYNRFRKRKQTTYAEFATVYDDYLESDEIAYVASDYSSKYFTDALSAMFLNLELKKIILTDNNQYYINILNIAQATQTELIFLEILFGISLGAYQGERRTLSELTNFTNADYEKFEHIKTLIEYNIANKKIMSKYGETNSQTIRYGINVVMLTMFVSTVFIVLSYTVLGIVSVLIGMIVLFAFATSIINKMNRDNIHEVDKVLGLKNFLLSGSQIAKYDEEHLNIWSKYLVYATALGISDKVYEQIKQNYKIPVQITDPGLVIPTIRSNYGVIHYSNNNSKQEFGRTFGSGGTSFGGNFGGGGGSGGSSGGGF
jgi:uncharacterized membrane protein